MPISKKPIRLYKDSLNWSCILPMHRNVIICCCETESAEIRLKPWYSFSDLRFGDSNDVESAALTASLKYLFLLHISKKWSWLYIYTHISYCISPFFKWSSCCGNQHILYSPRLLHIRLSQQRAYNFGSFCVSYKYLLGTARIYPYIYIILFTCTWW